MSFREQGATGSVETSALGQGRASIITSDDGSLVRLTTSSREIVLGTPGGSGSLEVVHVRSPDADLAETRPEHIGPDAVFVRTDKDLLGFRLPRLEPPTAGDEDFEVSARSIPGGGCSTQE
ncbi:MAG: hypothetical protein H5U40_17940 [Polyangiaceae bacterium]|nr:hypothetical protein [Polyangiaceae bacterium]